jgi:UDP-N-acetylglucosamine diphosphorylase / glucose-1-phosphate thymidylyltransferase / UDP-N-acetylgalactosamine diphosphorylase / glucosamine-1-phosphate N-acetyltransferase / galactosamine-1-phosphate N-acetyltransferase
VDAVVMAAGLGTRLRPLTERWPKAVLPIDGRPVISVLLRELTRARCGRVWVVTGHLADQVERLVGDGSAFGVDVRFVHQPEVLGSADAVRRALDAGAPLPVVVVAADTVFTGGDVTSFVSAFEASGDGGAVGVRTDPGPGEGRKAVRRSGNRIVALRDDDPASVWTPAPLWGVGAPVAERLCRDRPPYELGKAFEAAIAAGEVVRAIEIGKTRDLTDPLDLVEENFPYLRVT